MKIMHRLRRPLDALLHEFLYRYALGLPFATNLLSFQITISTSIALFPFPSMIAAPPSLTMATLVKDFSRMFGMFATGSAAFNTCHCEPPFENWL